MKTKKIAVVGATGMVGRTFLSVLSEKGIDVKNVTALASNQSKGKQISFGEDDLLNVESLENFDFTGIDIALFSPGSEISKIYAPIAASKGCLVIDNTSYFRMDKDVPLVVPEVNPMDVFNHKKNIIANPNCSTIQMVVALKPIDDLFDIKSVTVSTYQSVSGAGQKAMDELFSQTRGVLVNDAIDEENSCFSKPIAFNVIPKIDDFLKDGFTKEEWKMMNETQKIFHKNIDVVATCVRVPVFIGHSLSINVTCDQDIDLTSLKKAIKKTKGLSLIDNIEKNHFITPIDASGEDTVYISRLRQDPHNKKSLALWVVADNIRKGAATNAIQIAEIYCKGKI
ncbi:MAG: aspartate-semialdehyde dehydrogenase [Proteobacteria bacterium]|nr:aspartate-semialdehyde dehydrogenase [Pseudomonadota bacterium]